MKKFVCNAHGINPDTEYALICYQDDWPGIGLLLLGTGIAHEAGNVHMEGQISFEKLLSYQYNIGKAKNSTL